MAIVDSLAEAFITVSDSELKVYKVRLFSNTQGIEQALPQRRTFTLDPLHHDSPIALDIDKDGDTIIHKDAYVSIPKSTILLPESAKDRTVQYFPPNGGARPNGTLIIGSRRGQHTTPPIGVYLSDLDLGAGSTSQRPTAPKPKVSQSSCNPWAANSRDVVPGEDLDLARIKTQDGFLESAELKDMTFSVHFGQDLELMHERTRLPIRRIDELDGQVIFKTPTGAGTAVMKANKEDESAKLNWYHELSSPIEVYENMDHA